MSGHGAALHRTSSQSSSQSRKHARSSRTDDGVAEEESSTPTAGGTGVGGRQYGPRRSFNDVAMPSASSFSTSYNQKTPARSFYHRSFHGPLGEAPSLALDMVQPELTFATHSSNRCGHTVLPRRSRTECRACFLGCVRCRIKLQRSFQQHRHTNQ